MAMRRLVLLYVSCFLFIVSTTAQASWRGPCEIIHGNWGNGKGEFGIEYGDTSDTVPYISSIMPDNILAISDMVNRKYAFYTTNGKLLREVNWKVHREGNKTTLTSDVKVINNIRVYKKDGNVLAGAGKKYYLYSVHGKLLKTYTNAPPELGDVKRTRQTITVDYPDRRWIINTSPKHGCFRFIRDACDVLYCINDSTTRMNLSRIGDNGSILDRLEIPPTRIRPTVSRDKIKKMPPELEIPTETLEEYGHPMVAPDGDIYTWKRTKKYYSIIKWVWTDGPDAPVIQKTVSNKAGIKLTWKMPEEKGNTITGYEIERSDNVCGPFEPIGKVKRGVLTYTDREKIEKGQSKTDLFCQIWSEMSRYIVNSPKLCYKDDEASRETTYYYRVRALYKKGHSGYSNKAIGK